MKTFYVGMIKVVRIVWYGIVWYDIVWYGMIWYDIVWYLPFSSQHCGKLYVCVRTGQMVLKQGNVGDKSQFCLLAVGLWRQVKNTPHGTSIETHSYSFWMSKSWIVHFGICHEAFILNI